MRRELTIFEQCKFDKNCTHVTVHFCWYGSRRPFNGDARKTQVQYICMSPFSNVRFRLLFFLCGFQFSKENGSSLIPTFQHRRNDGWAWWESSSPNDFPNNGNESQKGKSRPRYPRGWVTAIRIAAGIDASAVNTLVIREHNITALVVHVSGWTKPLRPNISAKNSGRFDAIFCIVSGVAGNGRRGIGISVEFGAKGVNAGVTDDTFDRGNNRELRQNDKCHKR